jgi:hypothetical protein
MNTNDHAARPGAQATAPWRLLWAEANHPMIRNSTADPAAPCCTQKTAYMTNVITCLSLWISLLAAIWFVRGWIGLFFSGQVLSAGACLLQVLAKRTHYAFAASGIDSHRAQIRFMPGERDYHLNIEYLGRLEIAITGRFTGRLYRFNCVQPIQQVDPRDAFYLLASRRFGVAS